MKQLMQILAAVAVTVLVMIFVNSVNSMDLVRTDDQFVTRFDRLSLDFVGPNGKITFDEMEEHRDLVTKSIFWLAQFEYSGEKFVVAVECIDLRGGAQFRPMFTVVQNLKTKRRYMSWDEIPMDGSYFYRYIGKVCGASKSIYL